MDWSRWPNFSEAELACKHTGKCLMDPAFMDRLQRLRGTLGYALPITSGYRDASHPVERAKKQPGSHNRGRAVDIAVTGEQAFHLVMVAGRLGFTGVGVAKTFIHLDDLVDFHAHRPTLWVYE
jgi:zinc D-Ala-D-Ala carboxypeptidase